MRVLVADDDRALSHVLCARLRAQGWEPTAAFDSMQALLYAMRTPPPDVIILDINMPGETGLETLKRLKGSARTSRIPVVVMSATTSQHVAATAAALGADRFVTKPVDPQAFSALLSELRGTA
jgi:DNA-binding response OmpR family regulator